MSEPPPGCLPEEEVILPPPTGFDDDVNHDYEEIPHDVSMDPYLPTLSPDFDPDSCKPPSICSDSLLEEIEACRRDRSTRMSILNEFDPLRSKNEEPYYASVCGAKALEKAFEKPPVDFSTFPRESIYSSHSDSSSSGFEDSLSKEVLPKFEDTLCLGDGLQLAGYKLCTQKAESVSREGYLYQFSEERKDFARLWCALKDGMFNPFAGPVPGRGRVARKWCLETRFITTICAVERNTLG